MSEATFYRPYFNEETGETAMLSDAQFAALPPDSPWREIRPGDPLTPAEEYPPDGVKESEAWQPLS